MARKKFKYQDAVEYVKKQLTANGAEELKDNYFLINGWRVKITNRGFYWNNRILPEFEFVANASDYEIKSGKPFTSRHDIQQYQIERIVKNLLTTKTQKQKNRESRQAAALKRIAARRLHKRSFCVGCPYGTHEKKCDHMQNFEESYGIFTCKNEKWWNWNWCENAVRVYDNPKKVFLGYFKCKATGEKCPYNTETVVKGEYILARNYDNEHFTTCELYRGHRVDPDSIEVLQAEPQVKPYKRKNTKRG